MEKPTLAQPKRINWRNLITILSIMILIATEVFGVAIAGGWAIAGLFELGSTVGYALMGLFSLLAAYVMVAVWRLCTKVEPITQRA
jgi:membrane protein implicated in regulation of membrane protease activity